MKLRESLNEMLVFPARIKTKKKYQMAAALGGKSRISGWCPLDSEDPVSSNNRKFI